MKKYLIYKTINLINGKFYIGAHETKNINDSYLGSGKALKRAIVKYGKNNFKKEIIKECSSREQMYLDEQILLQSFIGDKNCYNLKHGGVGGWDYVNSNGLLVGDNNPMKDELIKNKCIENATKTKNKNLEKYKTIAILNLEKAIKANTGKKKPEHSQFMTEWATDYWKENKEKQRDALSSWFKVIDPLGICYETNRLQEFCLTKGIPYTTIWKSSLKNTAISKGKAKGWLCQKI